MPQLSVRAATEKMPLWYLPLQSTFISSYREEICSPLRLYEYLPSGEPLKGPIVTMWQKPFGEISLIRSADVAIGELQAMGVSIKMPIEIEEYFLMFPDMMETTQRITYLARQRLPEARLSLEVYKDPEAEDRHLVLYARFPHYDESTMEKIRAVRKEYRAHLVDKHGWLLLTTDFQLVE